MTVKKFLHMTSLIMLISIALPASSAILSEPVKTTSATNTENPRAQALLERLNNIKEIDKSEITRLERKSLRKEVREIKKEMKEVSGGVYLSVGVSSL